MTEEEHPVAVIHRIRREAGAGGEARQELIVELVSGRAFATTYPADATAAELARFLAVLETALVPAKAEPK